MKTRDPAEIDAPRLRSWLDGELGGSVEIEVEALAGGGSCEIFSIRRGAEHWVLRRAPVRASSSTAHDVLREHRILDAIKDEDVRIARPIVACADPEVAGSPFYIMEFVDGVPIRHALPEVFSDSPSDQSLALTELIDALVEVHGVDWRARGLDGLGKPERYLERQVPRWLSQLDSYRCRELSEVDDIASWLSENLPTEQPPALVHGDYKLDNVLYARMRPAQILAVVDWEMASIGDPLVDLAWALIFLPEEGNALSLGAAGQPGGFQLPGLPTRSELIERYVAGTGRDVRALDWYNVFSPWKLAIVLEGSNAKLLRGESKNPAHKLFGPLVDMLLARAAKLVKGG